MAEVARRASPTPRPELQAHSFDLPHHRRLGLEYHSPRLSLLVRLFVMYACSLFLFPLNWLNKTDLRLGSCTISNVVHCLPIGADFVLEVEVVLERGATALPCTYAIPVLPSSN